MTILWIVSGGFVILIVAVAALYNGLVRGKKAVDEAWSGIEAQLRHRHGLPPKLVSVVRQYASHERSLFEEVGAACSRSMSITGDVSAQAKAESALSGKLHSLFTVAEAYTDLKTNASFLQLRRDLENLEDDIQMARRYYNESARKQNIRLRRFPGNLVASYFHFETVDSFELDGPAETPVPNVPSLHN
jgi:LemA protein